MKIALHGFTATKAMWHDLGVQGPTLLGHGPQALANGDETFALEVARLTSELPAEPVHLIGYSLGARLSLAIALATPTRVHTLSLIGINPGIEDEGERALRVASDSAWSEKLRTEGIAAFVDAWESLALWETQTRLSLVRREALRQARMAHNPEQLARAMDALGTGSMPPMWQALGALQIPVQVIVGALDSKYVAIGARISQMLSNASLHLIAGAGHNPVFEDPQSVRNVLNEVP
jgi:2-succinyl-6-hydroxy-2,4-cyclohexadiene-1-carboxylate synthase